MSFVWGLACVVIVLFLCKWFFALVSVDIPEKGVSQTVQIVCPSHETSTQNVHTLWSELSASRLFLVSLRLSLPSFELIPGPFKTFTIIDFLCSLRIRRYRHNGRVGRLCWGL